MADQSAHQHAGEEFARAMESANRILSHNEELAAKIEQMERDHAGAIAALTVERDRFEQAAAIARTENEEIRRQLRTMKTERDHYFRCFTSGQAHMKVIAEACIAGIQKIEADSIGERTGPRLVEEQQRLTGAPRQQTPRFLQRGPAATEHVADLTEAAAAV